MKHIHTPSLMPRALSIATLVATVGIGAIPAHAQTAPSRAASAAMGSMGSGTAMSGRGSEQMHKSMMGGMEKMQQMKPSGDTDKDFAMMMKMHHQQALEMAKPEIEHGKSPELKAMARKIVKDQTKEIAQLDAWLKKHP